MDTLAEFQLWIGRIGGMAALLVLVVAFAGIWSGLHRPTGRTHGALPGLLRSILFYAAVSVFFFGVCYLLWYPLPLTLAAFGQVAFLAAGSLLYFSGLGLYLWGRQVLGRMYFVSTTMGAQLFVDHRLVVHGPYAWVRHPMYLACILAALGGLLIYQTWTLLFLLCGTAVLILRARREEQALSAEFGTDWQVYTQRVPAWLPRLRHRV